MSTQNRQTGLSLPIILSHAQVAPTTREETVSVLAKAALEDATVDLQEVEQLRRHEYITSERARVDIDNEVARKVCNLGGQIHELQRQVHVFCLELKDGVTKARELRSRLSDGVCSDVQAIDQELLRVGLPTSYTHIAPLRIDVKTVGSRALVEVMSISSVGLLPSLLGKGRVSLDKKLASLDIIRSFIDKTSKLWGSITSTHALRECLSLGESIKTTTQLLKPKYQILNEHKDRFSPSHLGVQIGRAVATGSSELDFARGGYYNHYRFEISEQDDALYGALKLVGACLNIGRCFPSIEEIDRIMKPLTQRLEAFDREEGIAQRSLIVASREQEIREEVEKLRKELKGLAEIQALRTAELVQDSIEGQILVVANPTAWSERGKRKQARTLEESAYASLRIAPYERVEEVEAPLVRTGLVPANGLKRATNRLCSEAQALLDGTKCSKDFLESLLIRHGMIELERRAQYWKEICSDLKIGRSFKDFLTENLDVLDIESEPVKIYENRLRAFVGFIEESPIKSKFDPRERPELFKLTNLEATVEAHRRGLIEHYLSQFEDGIDVEHLVGSDLSPGAVLSGINLLTAANGPLADPEFGAALLRADRNILSCPNLEQHLTAVKVLRERIRVASPSMRLQSGFPDLDSPYPFMPEHLESAITSFNELCIKEQKELIEIAHLCADYTPSLGVELLSYSQFASRQGQLVQVLSRAEIEASQTHYLIENNLCKSGVMADFFFEKEPGCLSEFNGSSTEEQIVSYLSDLGEFLRALHRCPGALDLQGGCFNIKNNPAAFSPKNLRDTQIKFAAAQHRIEELLEGDAADAHVRVTEYDSENLPFSEALISYLNGLAQRAREIDRIVSEASGSLSFKRRVALTRERGQIEEALKLVRRFQELQREPESSAELKVLEDRIITRAIGTDPIDARSAVVEISRAISDYGDVLVEDTFAAYSSILSARGFGIEIDGTEAGECTDVGRSGFKNISFRVNGEGAFGVLKHEGGIHNFTLQLPGSSYRITGHLLISVYPQVENEELVIHESDIRMETSTSGGPGGQHANKTATKVRLTHIPTNTVVVVESERSQAQNRLIATKILRSKLFEQRRLETDAERVATRASQLGGRERSARSRKWDFINYTVNDQRLYNNLSLRESTITAPVLERIMDDLHRVEIERRLSELSQKNA